MRRPMTRVTSTTPGRATAINAVSRQSIAHTMAITPTAVTISWSSATRLPVAAFWMICTSLLSREMISPTRWLSKKRSDSTIRCS